MSNKNEENKEQQNEVYVEGITLIARKSDGTTEVHELDYLIGTGILKDSSIETEEGTGVHAISMEIGKSSLAERRAAHAILMHQIDPTLILMDAMLGGHIVKEEE